MNTSWNVLFLFLLFLLFSAEAAKKCSAPPSNFPKVSLAASYVGRETFSSGDKVYFKCLEDFVPIRGSRSVQCVNGKWTQMTLKCRKKMCGNAGELRNGVFHYKANTFIGQTVRAQCDKGYTLMGSAHLKCTSSGWAGEFPSCVVESKVTCPRPEVDHWARPAGDRSAYRVGEKLNFTCSPGFQLDGPQQISCGPDGLWRPRLPQCLPSPEPTPGEDAESKVTCPRPEVDHWARPAGVESAYRVGEKLNFTCSPGFQLDGPQQISCGPDGLWQPRLPQCLPSPEPTPGGDAGGNCSTPTFIQSARARPSDTYLERTSFAPGEKVYYECDVGYGPVGGSRYRICASGTWTPLRFQCERKRCGSAGELLNGQFEYTGVKFGDTATAVCNKGYTLVGRSTRHCLDRGWDGRVPVCEVVKCGEPPAVANAVRRDWGEPPFPYMRVIRYRCTSGSFAGSGEITCIEDGMWSAPPKCW